jgi:hypothetical protein
MMDIVGVGGGAVLILVKSANLTNVMAPAAAK